MTAKSSFQWPEGKRAAVSLSFDDARPTQLDHGIPILNSFGVRGTFYVFVQAAERRAGGWRNAVRDGHEMGNHSVNHPCTCNFPWKATHVLEDYTLDQMETELLQASVNIKQLLDVTPKTFAFPCGQTYVGRGEGTRSYVPVIAKHFLAGRGFRNECANDPAGCDLAYLMGVDADDQPFASLAKWVEQAVQNNSWLVLVGHEMGVGERQTMSREVLEQLCRHITDPAQNLWVDTVANIGAYVQSKRQKE